MITKDTLVYEQVSKENNVFLAALGPNAKKTNVETAMSEGNDLIFQSCGRDHCSY